MSYLSRDRRYAGDRESFLQPFYEAMGSIPFIPYREGEDPLVKFPRRDLGGSAANSWGNYGGYIRDKQRELDAIEKEAGGKWTVPDPVDPDPVDPDPVDPDPVDPDPEPEIDPERKAAQDKWRRIFAKQIEEGMRNGRSEQDSLDDAVYYSRVMTPEENADYNWAFEGIANNGYGVRHKKWGGGRKGGSAGGSIAAARRGNKSGPGLGFSLGQAARGIAARFSSTQGRPGGGRNNSATKGGRTAPGGQGAGAMRSDIQLKENIAFIDKSPEGHSIYEWNYKGEPKSNRYQGVMAQELLKTAPHAVVEMDNGYLGVKYDEIDVDFTAI